MILPPHSSPLSNLIHLLPALFIYSSLAFVFQAPPSLYPSPTYNFFFTKLSPFFKKINEEKEGRTEDRRGDNHTAKGGPGKEAASRSTTQAQESILIISFYGLQREYYFFWSAHELQHMNKVIVLFSTIYIYNNLGKVGILVCLTLHTH